MVEVEKEMPGRSNAGVSAKALPAMTSAVKSKKYLVRLKLSNVVLIFIAPV
jgi:hypothetical protein